jgi:predicted ATP-grasp superfamily ATP-dependent carboligase
MAEASTSESESAPIGRAIVTYSRSWHALAAIRSLGRRGVEVIAGDEYAVTPGALSRHTIGRFQYPAEGLDPAGFLDALEEAVDRFAPPSGVPYVIVPMHEDTYLIAKERARFDGKILVPLPGGTECDLVKHKGRLVRHARSQGVAMPPTWLPESVDALRHELDQIALPAYVKLPESTAGIGIEKVDTREELLEAFTKLAASAGSPEAMPVVQAAVGGEDYCVTALFDRGALKASLTYKNVLTFPRDHGPGAVRETVVAPKLERIAVELLRPLAWHGMAQLDFRWTGRDEDEAPLIEVNPRFFGGLFQAIASGVDYPWLLFCLAAHGRVDPPQHIEIGTRTEAPVVGLLATLSEILEQHSRIEELESAWHAAKHQLGLGRAGQALKTLLLGLEESVDVAGRIEHVREVLESNSQNLSMLFDSDDPLPVLGVIYPLAVFVRHGKLSRELLAGGHEAA